MSLSIGIVGLPNVGKSTLFNALTDNNILAANYPFATIEPNSGIVAVPDDRLQKLAKIYNSQKIIPASVKFIDIAGLVAGASSGEGLGNQFLSHIRSTNAICHVVRAFDDSNVLHVDTKFSPKNDIDVINTELILADMQTIEKRLAKTEKESRTNPKLKPIVNEINKAKIILDGGITLNHSSEPINYDLIADLQLITAKPVIYLFNVDEQTLANPEKQHQLSQLVGKAQSVFVCAKLEDELRGLNEEESAEMLETYGQTSSGLNKLIHATYKTLGLQSYLTAGEKEVRAWTINQGNTAPQAAGVIHGDFERGFIAAQIISYKDLISAGSEHAVKAAGKIATVGKDYVMKPDDIVEFRFNV